MKFWQKTFLATLALFLVAFDVGIFMLADMSYKNSMQSEQQKCLGEHYFITSAISKDMDAVAQREGSYDQPEDMEAAYRSLCETYGEYYISQGIYLEVLMDGKTLYTSLPPYSGEREELSVAPNERNTIMRDVAGSIYYYVAGDLPVSSGNAMLIYAKDLTLIVEEQRTLEENLVFVSILISACLAVALYFVLSSLSRPIKGLSNTTRRIAAGNFSERVKATGRDEFGELGQSFNNMADEIEEQMVSLEKAAEQKQQFIDNLAHELRTPLTTIYGYAEYIKAAAITEEDRILAVDYIMSESSRLKEVAFKLLDLALLKNTGIDRNELDVQELIEAAAMTVYPKTREKQIQLKTKFVPAIVKGDKALLISLLVNILDNAAKASDVHGTIMVRNFFVGDEGKDIIIEVLDNGRGMTKEQLDQIVLPFYRVDKARSREQGGAGLGLSLCAQIARAHNAEIRFYSKPEKGTVVRIIFYDALREGEYAPDISAGDDDAEGGAIYES